MVTLPQPADILKCNKPHAAGSFFIKNGQISAVELYEAGILKKSNNTSMRMEFQQTLHYKVTKPNFPGGTKAWSKYLPASPLFPTQPSIVQMGYMVVVVVFCNN
jgi:hypothetical protein